MRDYKQDLSPKQVLLLEKAVEPESKCFIRFLESLEDRLHGTDMDAHAFDNLEKEKTKKSTIKALYELHSSGVSLKKIEQYIEEINVTINEDLEDEYPFIFYHDPPVDVILKEEKMLDHEHFEWTINQLEEVAALNIQRLVRRGIDKKIAHSKGYITSKQKDKDWPQIRQSMLDEGFTESEIQGFHKNNYKAKQSKKRSKRQSKKRSKRPNKTKKPKTKKKENKI
jgi:hypothetical protein